MARIRLFAALLPAPDQWAWLDEVRRGLEVPEPFRIPPHVTLVPPVNVAASDLDEVDRTLAAAVTVVEPFELALGAASTFLPDTPTVQLSVGGDLVSLGRLRDRLVSGPLDRPGRRPFVPHVTLVPAAEQATIDAALLALRGVSSPWPVRSVHVLERRHDPGRWVTVAELPLGAPRVVGRGTRPCTLRTLRMVPAPVAELCRVAARGPAERPGADEPLVVVAEDDPGDGTGAPAGAAVGVVGPAGVELRSLVVEPTGRGTGLGAHLLAEWCSQAATTGARLVVAPAGDASGSTFLRRHGFSVLDGPSGPQAVRLL